MSGGGKARHYTRAKPSKVRAPMKRVHAGTDPVQCGWLESVLAGAGIACLVRNRYLGGAIGELPLNEAWPEIWVLDDADAARAERLIAEALAPGDGEDAGAWTCAGCGEAIEGHFAQCWRCGGAR